jgi:hypothetical protein
MDAASMPPTTWWFKGFSRNHSTRLKRESNLRRTGNKEIFGEMNLQPDIA